MHLSSFALYAVIAIVITCATATVQIVETGGGFVYYATVIGFREYRGRQLPTDIAFDEVGVPRLFGWLDTSGYTSTRNDVGSNVPLVPTYHISDQCLL